MKTKTIFAALLFIGMISSCHKERYIEYVAEMSIQTFGFDSANINVSGYLTNTIENYSLGYSYTTEGAVYSWNSQNVFIDPAEVTDGAYSSAISNLESGSTYRVKPFASINGTKYYTDNEFMFTMENPPNAIGDIGPGGGIVFYSDGHGGGMEVLITNWHGIWVGYNTSVPATGTYFGAGQLNTNVILNYTTNSDAGQMCDSCTAGGYTDWFLPSYEELSKIQQELSDNSAYNLPNEVCWTSSASSGGIQYSWVIDLTD